MKYLFTLVCLLWITQKSISQSQALNFDGINDYVTLNDVSNHLSSTDNFTIEFWMKTDFNNTSNIRVNLFSINKPSPYDNEFLIIMGGLSSQQGKLMIYDQNSPGSNFDFVSSVVIGDDECHHIAYVKDASTGRIYIDGILVGTHIIDYTISSNHRYSIGQDWDGNTASDFFEGNFDDFRIWKSAKSITEINNLMSDNNPTNTSDLIVNYNFNQGVSSGNNTSILEVTDLSSNGIHGQMSGFGLINSNSNFVLNSCSSNLDTNEITVCGTYVSPNGNTMWTNSGVYSDTLLSSSGLDSIVLIDLTILPLPNTQVNQLSNGNLESVVLNAKYQWFMCEGDVFLPIVDDTNSLFTPTLNGSYAVEITLNGCVDTSQCYWVKTLSLASEINNNAIKIYPNPVDNLFTVEFRSIESQKNIQIFSVSGLLIKTVSIAQGEKTITQVLDLPMGVYVFKVEEDNFQTFKKVIKR